MIGQLTNRELSGGLLGFKITIGNSNPMLTKKGGVGDVKS
jgi:hypothetical protein